MVRAARRGPRVRGTPAVLAPGQSAVRTRAKSPRPADEQTCRDVRLPAELGVISEVREFAVGSGPLVETRRAPGPRAMSRRKQAKPQHLNSEEPQAARQGFAEVAGQVAEEQGE